jgi:hypothetical protein
LKINNKIEKEVEIEEMEKMKIKIDEKLYKTKTKEKEKFKIRGLNITSWIKEVINKPVEIEIFLSTYMNYFDNESIIIKIINEIEENKQIHHVFIGLMDLLKKIIFKIMKNYIINNQTFKNVDLFKYLLFYIENNLISSKFIPFKIHGQYFLNKIQNWFDEIEDILKTLKFKEVLNYDDIQSKVQSKITNVLTEIPLNEIAIQLTILEYEDFIKLQEHELYNVKWRTNPDSTPSVHYLSRKFDQISLWVANEIIHSHDDDDRVEKISKFLKIAKYLLEMKNFQTLISICAGLLRFFLIFNFTKGKFNLKFEVHLYLD